jgi:glycosyltransferase involved in cell wall biosynthesis
MNTIKTVLISTAWFPHDGVGSWTTEINYLLQKENHIDYIIGPKAANRIEKPVQIFIDKVSVLDKIKGKKEPLNRFNPYVRALQKVLQKEEKIVLQVKDNFGLLKALLLFIKKQNLRKRVYVQYHYHSFHPFTTEETLLSQIDELVLLTESAYQSFKETLNSLPVKVTVCGDGVDSEIFKPVSQSQKIVLKDKLGIPKEGPIFIWCSQDRKKKGLDIVLEAWTAFIKKHPDAHLLIVGLTRNVTLKNVTFLGQIPNHELTEYYQSSDFYLFPTLWQEGFGLSLVEALKCGCFCIAAKNGAVNEVLKEGSYGMLIEKPNFVEEWVQGMTAALEIYKNEGFVNPYIKSIPEKVYDIEDWYKRYNVLSENAKRSFNLRFYI